MKSPKKHETLQIELFAEVPLPVEQAPDGEGESGCLPNAYPEQSQSSSHARPLPVPEHEDPPEAAPPDGTEEDCNDCDNLPVGSEADPETTTPQPYAGPAPVKAKAKPDRHDAKPYARMMRARDVAAYMSCSLSKVWRLARGNSNFPRPTKIGKSTRWDRHSIDDYLDSLPPQGSQKG